MAVAKKEDPLAAIEAAKEEGASVAMLRAAKALKKVANADKMHNFRGLDMDLIREEMAARAPKKKAKKKVEAAPTIGAKKPEGSMTSGSQPTEKFGMNRMTHMSDHYASDIGSKADKKNLGMEFDRQSDEPLHRVQGAVSHDGDEEKREVMSVRSGDRGSEGARSGKTKSTEKGPTLVQRFMEWVALRRKSKKIFWFYCAVLSPWTLGVVLSLVWFCSSVEYQGMRRAPQLTPWRGRPCRTRRRGTVCRRSRGSLRTVT